MMSNISHYNHKGFLELSSIDAQKYIFYNGFVANNMSEIHIVDNDEIFAFFKNRYTLLDKKTYFFRRCINEEFIIYDKTTRKVRISKKISYELQDKFSRYFFKGQQTKCIVMKCITKGFIKKVIENKINTIEDIVKYYRSYILKQKSAQLSGVLTFLCISQNVWVQQYTPFIKNWELLLNTNNIIKMSMLEPLKLNCVNKELHTEEDLDYRTLQNEYDNWANKISREINKQ